MQSLDTHALLFKRLVVISRGKSFRRLVVRIQFCLKSFSKIMEKRSRQNISILNSAIQKKTNLLVENYIHTSFVTNVEFLIVYSIVYLL